MMSSGMSCGITVETATTGNGFGHAPSSNSCHIGNNHGNGGTHEIGCSEIYIESAGDI